MPHAFDCGYYLIHAFFPGQHLQNLAYAFLVPGDLFGCQIVMTGGIADLWRCVSVYSRRTLPVASHPVQHVNEFREESARFYSVSHSGRELFPCHAILFQQIEPISRQP